MRIINGIIIIIFMGKFQLKILRINTLLQTLFYSNPHQTRKPKKVWKTQFSPPPFASLTSFSWWIPVECFTLEEQLLRISDRCLRIILKGQIRSLEFLFTIYMLLFGFCMCKSVFPCPAAFKNPTMVSEHRLYAYRSVVKISEFYVLV